MMCSKMRSPASLQRAILFLFKICRCDVRPLYLSNRVAQCRAYRNSIIVLLSFEGIRRNFFGYHQYHCPLLQHSSLINSGVAGPFVFGRPIDRRTWMNKFKFFKFLILYNVFHPHARHSIQSEVKIWIFVCKCVSREWNTLLVSGSISRFLWWADALVSSFENLS